MSMIDVLNFEQTILCGRDLELLDEVTFLTGIVAFEPGSSTDPA